MLFTSYILNRAFKKLNFKYVFTSVESDGCILCNILVSFKKSVKTSFIQESISLYPEVGNIVCDALTLEGEQEMFDCILDDSIVYPTVTNCSRISLILKKLKKK